MQCAQNAIPVFCDNLDLWGRAMDTVVLVRTPSGLRVATSDLAGLLDPAIVGVLWSTGPHPIDPILSVATMGLPSTGYQTPWPETFAPVAIAELADDGSVYTQFRSAVGEPQWPRDLPNLAERTHLYQIAVIDPATSTQWFDTAAHLPDPWGAFIRSDIAPRMRQYVFKAMTRDNTFALEFWAKQLAAIWPEVVE